MVDSREWDPELIPLYDVRASSRPRIKAVMMDACNKLNELGGLGKSQVGMVPVFSTYFGSAHMHIREHTGKGMRVVLEDAAADDDGVELGAAGLTCHPNLSCARHWAGGGGALDTFGVVGGTCCHGVPLRGAFASMPAAEQFSYYDALLERLQQRVHIMDFYLDVNCK